MTKNQILEDLKDMVLNHFNKIQSSPDQYVVAYFKKDDDSLIGYHLDSFCNISKDILKAKRYAGENCSEQLEVIFKNISYILNNDHEGIFSTAYNYVKECFNYLTSDDIYIDAIYLAQDTPKQSFNCKIIDNNPIAIDIDIHKNLN
jgi:hypothetical protein